MINCIICIFIFSHKVHALGRHTTPEWANQQQLCPEKYCTTYCQGPLGLPKNAFGQM